MASILAVCFSFLIKKENTGNGPIKLIVRADDMASFHAANLACTKVYTNGIARSVEVMVPCAWFPEAVKLLSANPKYDVGVHLVLTSEWDNVKWRPLTLAPSLVDKDGYFFGNIWKNKNSLPNTTLLESNWKIEEIEKEFRAQIDLARKYLPRISHLTAHMGCTDMDKKVKTLVQKLAKEYQLGFDDDFKLNYMKGTGDVVSTDDKIEAFVKNIKNLTPGTWVYVDHPGLENEEMQRVNTDSLLHLGKDRQAVTDIWTNDKVKNAILEKGIELIAYKDLIKHD
jgi:hypothetical protein